MKRRPLPITATLAATAALLLTGCGSSDDNSNANDKVASTDTSEASKSTSPSPSEPDAAERPQVALPDDVENVFENWQTADSTLNALLADVERRINATDAAIVAGDPDFKALGFYYADDALVEAADLVKGYKDDGKSITGTTRYFNPQLRMSDDKTGTIAYCSDESKAYDKDRKTDKVEKTTAAKNSYVSYNTQVEKNNQGVWQTTILLSERGNSKCAP